MSRRHDAACLEHLAESFLHEANAGPSPDAMELARHAGLVPTPSEVRRAEFGPGGVLRYRAEARHSDQQRWVAFQLASWLLEQTPLQPSHRAIHHTASALMLPREAFSEEASHAGWNVRALRDLYPNASLRTIAYRIVTLQPAAATWFVQGRTQWRWVHDSFEQRLSKPTRYEQYLAEISLESDEILHPEARMWAYPLNRNFGMTLLLCDAERLLAKE